MMNMDTKCYVTLCLFMLLALPAAGQPGRAAGMLREAGGRRSILQCAGSIGGRPGRVATAGRIACVGVGAYLDVVDLGPPQKKRLIRQRMADYVEDILIHGKFAYVALSGGKLCTLDLSKPGAPKELFLTPWVDPKYSITLKLQGPNLLLNGYYVYHGREHYHGIVLDISEPAKPCLVTQYKKDTGVYYNKDTGSYEEEELDPEYQPNPNAAQAGTIGYALPFDAPASEEVDFAWQGSLGGLIYEDTLHVLNLAEPSDPKITSTMELPEKIANRLHGSIAVSDRFACLTLEKEVSFVDLANPDKPVMAGSLDGYNYPENPVTSGSLVVFNSGMNFVSTVDARDPYHPGLLGSLQLMASNGNRISRLALHDGLAYALCSGLQVIDLSRPAEPRLLGSLEWDYDWSDHVYDKNPNFIAPIGKRVFTPLLFDVSDPAAPQYVEGKDVGASLKLEGELEEMASAGNWIYQLRYRIEGLSKGHLYELVAIDVSDPLKPKVKGIYPGLCAPRRMIAHGNLVAFVESSGGLTILRNIEASGD